MLIDRRLLLKGAALGAGVLALPAWAQVLAARGFTHDVASGEPGPDRVMLWTRYIPEAGATGRLRWQISRDAEFTMVVAAGETEAAPERDWCVKPVATGLAPGGWYYYRFLDAAGQTSPVGRTRTLPDGPVGKFTLGVFSCSNLPFGHFNAYAHAAARADIDLMIHLGDYIYEYPVGTYPSLDQAVAGRLIQPATEIIALADYRLRYASYRSDPDLQRLHRMFPMVMMWDDHETANNSWVGGAQNHQPETEGPWDVRKAAITQAYREWMPISDEAWTRYRIGNLADLFRPETRLTGRDKQFEVSDILRDRPDRAGALTQFRDGPWQEPARSVLGLEQERWLTEGLRRSTGEGVKWQILGQQVIMGSMSFAPEIVNLLGESMTDALRQRAELVLAQSQAGLPMNLDMWDGYPAARTRLLGSSQEADANLIVLSGDSHNAWAFELPNAGMPAGTEFAVHSVTSPGNEGSIPADPAEVARAYVGHNEQLKWADTSRRGYLTVELTPQRATGEWVFMDTVRERSLVLAGRHTMRVAHGTNRFVGA
jgi:alkaline phosphatase D